MYPWGITYIFFFFQLSQCKELKLTFDQKHLIKIFLNISWDFKCFFCFLSLLVSKVNFLCAEEAVLRVVLCVPGLLSRLGHQPKEGVGREDWPWQN